MNHFSNQELLANRFWSCFDMKLKDQSEELLLSLRFLLSFFLFHDLIHFDLNIEDRKWDWNDDRLESAESNVCDGGMVLEGYLFAIQRNQYEAWGREADEDSTPRMILVYTRGETRRYGMETQCWLLHKRPSWPPRYSSFTLLIITLIIKIYN
jgi:hypothetical protein